MPTSVPSMTSENRKGGRRKSKMAKSTMNMLDIRGVSNNCLSTLLIKISCTEPKIAMILLKSGNVFVAIVKISSVKCHVHVFTS
jgi:hypothetical protein